MIYTIGHTSSYEQYFLEQHPEGPYKKGRDATYPGGSVWLTFEEAQNNCPIGYSVYGVEADWEKDTLISSKGIWHDLLKDSKLIRILN
jgi:hypothetical protein